MARKEKFNYKPLAMLFLGIIIGFVIVCMFGIKDTSWIKDIVSVECSANVNTKHISLDNNNFYENINWLKYDCNGNVTISEHKDSLYFSTASSVGDSGEQGYCWIEYIETQKKIGLS